MSSSTRDRSLKKSATISTGITVDGLLNGFDHINLGLNSHGVKCICTYGNGTEKYTFNPGYMTIVYNLSGNERGAVNAAGAVSSLGHGDMCTGKCQIYYSVTN